MLRGNGGQEIFFYESDRYAFYLLLQEGIHRFGHRVHAFCLMGNHVHLLVQVGENALSRIMQNLAFRYTRWVNREQGRVGHLFQGRYMAVLVDADRYLLELVRYIHLNPVRAGLVSEPDGYRWSGHRAYLGVEEIPWLQTDWVLGLFARRLSTCRRRYAAFVVAGMDEGHRADFHGGMEDSRIVGDDDFVAQAIEEEPLSTPPPLGAILTCICEEYETSVDELGQPSRNRRLSEARGIIGWLATRTGAATLTEVSKMFHRDVSTMSHVVRRIDLAAQRESEFTRKLEDYNAILQA